MKSEVQLDHKFDVEHCHSIWKTAHGLAVAGYVVLLIYFEKSSETLMFQVFLVILSLAR